MRKIDVALHAKFIGRINADAAVLFDDFDGLDNFEVAAAATQPANASLIEKPQEWFGRAIEYGNLDRINVYEDVVDPRRINRREQMFGSGKQHALLHQAGGVADASDVAAASLNRKMIE